MLQYFVMSKRKEWGRNKSSSSKFWKKFKFFISYIFLYFFGTSCGNQCGNSQWLRYILFTDISSKQNYIGGEWILKWYNLVNFEKMEFHNRKKKHISTLARVNWFDIKCVNLVLNVTLKKLCFLCICRSLQLFCRIPQSLKFSILIMQNTCFWFH